MTPSIPRPSQAWRDVRALAWQIRGRLAAGLGLMLVNRVSALVLPACSKFVIDSAVIGGDRTALVMVALAAGTASAVQAGSAYALSQVLGVAAQGIISDLRKRVHRHVLRLPMPHFDRTPTGVLLSRIMTDAEGVRNLVGTGIVELAGGLLTMVLATAVLAYLSWTLTPVTLAVLAGFGGAMALAFTRLRPLHYERADVNAEVTGRLNETLGGIRVVKAYTAEDREHQVFARGADRLFDVVRRSMRAASATTALSTLFVGTVAVVVILVGGDAIRAGAMSVGDLVMFIFFVAILNTPVVQVASITTQLTEAFAGLDRIRETGRERPEDADEGARPPVDALKGDVVFEDVTFAYGPGEPVLRGVGFRAPAGTTTALVGPSGSGKSTLVGLVLAFHRPTRGRVLVDGRDLAGLPVRAYRSHLGAVLQDAFLFDGTIAENVRFSRPDTSEDDLRRVCRAAHCDEFVERLERGFETRVGERGVRLSGGQRQRLAIARALLADPRILVLDEAMSSLDSRTEALVQDALRSLRRGRTTFVIAHRLSTIRNADQILVLDRGEIVERGTYAELLAAAGLFRRLHDEQHRLDQERFVNPGEEFAVEPEAAS